MSKPEPLFTPLKLNDDITLQHRVVLAPLTRLRGTPLELAPTELHIEYYKQRATEGGLLISEGILISPEALAYASSTGIFTPLQVEGWRKVTEAVHKSKCFMSCQLWHTGRVARPDHPLCKERSITTCVSASDIPLRSGGPKPRALELDEIPRLIDDYRNAAINAKKANFDFVEIHAAHGYLIDQFLNDGVNKRTDAYGGSVLNRARILFEIIEAISTVYPLGRIGIRLSPTSPDHLKYNHESDSDPETLYRTVISELGTRYGKNLGYLLLSEPRWYGAKHDGDVANDPGFTEPLFNPSRFRHLYPGTIFGAGGFTPAEAKAAIALKKYDAIAFGRWFISNPDLVEKLKRSAKLNIYERKTFYSKGGAGYIDYPSIDGSVGIVGKYKLIEQSAIGKSLSAAKL